MTADLEWLKKSGLVNNAHESGSPERFRKKKPPDIDQAEWDKLIDDLVQRFDEMGPSPVSGHANNKQRDEMNRWVLEDVVAAGKRAGTITNKGVSNPKKDAVTELGGAANRQINENNRRLGLADEAEFEANQRDEAALGELKGAQAKASAVKHGVAANQRRDAGAANKASRDLLAGMGKDFQALNVQDQNSLADYLKSTDPMMAEIMARTSDPADQQRQLDAYAQQQGVVDKYKDLSDPQVTAKERYMSELARREFEASDLSNRKAVSEQLANRGLRSGGQQIAMQQATQQGLSQDRLLKELGIQAGAVDRSMKAMEGYNSATFNLSSSAGAIRTANDTQRQYEDTFRKNEAERRSKLAGERNSAVNTTTGAVGARDQTYAETGLEVEDTTYGRNKDVNKLDWDVGDEDYAMSGDYYDADTATGGRRALRANTGLTQGTATGGTNFNLLADKLSLQADQLADDEEHRLAFGGS